MWQEEENELDALQSAKELEEEKKRAKEQQAKMVWFYFYFFVPEIIPIRGNFVTRV